MTFDDHVRAALDSLPPELARALRNVAVVVEDENPEDPDLFGLYEGVPLPERGDEAGSLPDRIAIYRRPLEEDIARIEVLDEDQVARADILRAHQAAGNGARPDSARRRQRESSDDEHSEPELPCRPHALFRVKQVPAPAHHSRASRS